MKQNEISLLFVETRLVRNPFKSNLYPDEFEVTRVNCIFIFLLFEHTYIPQYIIISNVFNSHQFHKLNPCCCILLASIAQRNLDSITFVQILYIPYPAQLEMLHGPRNCILLK